MLGQPRTASPSLPSLLCLPGFGVRLTLSKWRAAVGSGGQRAGEQRPVCLRHKSHVELQTAGSAWLLGSRTVFQLRKISVARGAWEVVGRAKVEGA